MHDYFERENSFLSLVGLHVFNVNRKAYAIALFPHFFSNDFEYHLPVVNRAYPRFKIPFDGDIIEESKIKLDIVLSNVPEMHKKLSFMVIVKKFRGKKSKGYSLVQYNLNSFFDLV